MSLTSPTDPYGQLAHLQVIAGSASGDVFLEVRYRVGRDAMASEFHPARDRAALLESVNRRSRATDVYVGCAPRTRPEGRKEAVQEVWTLWAECDGAAATAAARRHIPRPALVIGSGSTGNVHAYWPLRHPVRPLEAEKANLRLARSLGADCACFDASRILRPPGTWNHKHDPPRPVEVLDLRLAVRFELGEVVGGLPHVDLAQVDRRWNKPQAARSQRSDPLLRLPPPVYVSNLLGRVASAGCKVRCPFHDDARPSLHVYGTAERGWFCYSCRRGGTIYDLAAELWGLQTRGRDFLRVRERLLERFPAELAQVRRLTRDPGLTL